jgi:predicted  nucleic acid-binding Zn-ribbon protein
MAGLKASLEKLQKLRDEQILTASREELRELNIDIDIAERQLHTLETQHRAPAVELAPNQNDLEALLKEKATVDEHNAVPDYLDEQRRQIDEAVETICREFRRLREISTDAACDRKWDSLITRFLNRVAAVRLLAGTRAWRRKICTFCARLQPEPHTCELDALLTDVVSISSIFDRR